MGQQDLHLWLCAADAVSGSDEFRRFTLSRYAPLAPRDWYFKTGENDKPYVASDVPRPLDFNLSHSGQWLACAVTAGVPVGVDLEHCDSRRATMKLARRFFHAREVAALQSCPEGQRADRFYDYWSLKEAGIKARGETLGMGIGRRGFDLSYPATGLGGSIRVTPPDPVSAASYYLFDMLPDYRLALCWIPASPRLPRLRFFELRDGDGVIELEVSLRAASRSA